MEPHLSVMRKEDPRGYGLQAVVRGSLSLQQSVRSHYFRKLAKYLAPPEYRRAQEIRDRTHAQIAVTEMLFLRWGIRCCRPTTLVEIGSFCGASTALMADTVQALGGGRIYAIDRFSQRLLEDVNHAGEYWKVFDQVMRPYAGWFEKIEGDSKTVPWERPIDFLFIDGDHSKEGVSADIDKYAPFVRVGGHLFFHDYVDIPKDNSMVETVVNRELLQNPHYRLLGIVDSLIGFQKVA